MIANINIQQIPLITEIVMQGQEPDKKMEIDQKEEFIEAPCLTLFQIEERLKNTSGAHAFMTKDWDGYFPHVSFCSLNWLAQVFNNERKVFTEFAL